MEIQKMINIFGQNEKLQVFQMPPQMPQSNKVVYKFFELQLHLRLIVDIYQFLYNKVFKLII